MSRLTMNVTNLLASHRLKPRGKLAKRAARWVVKHADQTARVRVQATKASPPPAVPPLQTGS